MKDELFRRFYIDFFTINFILCMLIIVFLFSIFFLFKRYQNKIQLTKERSVVLVFFIALIGIVYFGLKSSKINKDYYLVKNNECFIFEGKFVRYTVFTESNTPGEPNKSMPLFIDLYTEEEMIFSVNGDLVSGENYTIYYLPNTKISILVFDEETISDED